MTDRHNLSKRNADIDIIKFFSACMIMLCHITLFFEKEPNLVPFSSATIFNMIFFMVTGYYTGKHFLNVNNSLTNNPSKESLMYVLRKLKPILKYSTVCVIILYIYKMITVTETAEPIGIQFFLNNIEQALYDGLYMRSIGYIETDYGTLWYVSALLFVLPVICLLLQCAKLKKIYVYIFSWILPLVYFGYVRFQGISDPPHRMLYAFSALSLGVFLVVLTERINKFKISRFGMILLTILKWGLLFSFTAFCRINVSNPFLYTLAFICILLFALSSTTYHIPSTKITTFLGNDLSLVIYITHFVVFRIVAGVCSELPAYYQVSIGIIGTLLFSIVLVLIFKVWNHCRNRTVTCN